MTASTRDMALQYLHRGLSVLPLHHPTEHGGRLRCSCRRPDCCQPAKHPFGQLVRSGLKDASKDPAVVHGWFSQGDLNVGIATGAVSGLFVLDVDPRHGGDETLAELERKHNSLPSTWRFLTGGGGEHILFRHPGGRIPNSAGRVGRGLDVRGDGGYIVAPPSRHICGRTYEISVDHHPDEVELADAPSWLLNKLQEHGTQGSKDTNVHLRELVRSGACEGQRNDTVARVAGALLGRRVDPHLTLELALAFNTTRCHPPLLDDEVIRTVASIARRDRERRHG